MRAIKLEASEGPNRSIENNPIAEHFGRRMASQGGAQQGTGARGEQYLEGLFFCHTISAQGIV